MKIDPFRQGRLPALLDLLFLFLLAWYVFAGIKAAPFQGDESTLIRMSRDYDHIVQQGDPAKAIFRPQWGGTPEEQEEQYQRILTGSVTPLCIGLARDLAGMGQTDLNGFWVWWPDEAGLPPDTDMWAWNVARGNMPGERLLAVARIPSTLFTVLSMLAVFGIARALFRSRPAIWIATLLYITNPVVLVNGRRAMQEGAMLFFAALAICLALRMVRELKRPEARWGRLASWSVLLGLAGGLAMAGKHNALLAVAPAYLAVFLAPLLLRSHPDAGSRLRFWTRHACILLGSGLGAIALFLGLMPVWWGSWQAMAALAVLALLLLAAGVLSPDRHLRAAPAVAGLLLIGMLIGIPSAWRGLAGPARIIVAARQALMEQQMNQMGSMKTPAERAHVLLNTVFFAETTYFDAANWGAYPEMGRQIAAYEATRLDGRRGGTAWGILLIALTASGCGLLIRRRRDPALLLIGLWLILPAAVLLATNPLPWQRYYLVLAAPLAVIAGAGVEGIGEIVSRLRRRLALPG